MKKKMIVSLILMVSIIYLIFLYNQYSKKEAVSFCMNTNEEQYVIKCSESPFINIMTTEEYFRFLMLHRNFNFTKKNNEKLFYMQLSFAYGNCKNQEKCKIENKELIEIYQKEIL